MQKMLKRWIPYNSNDWEEISLNDRSEDIESFIEAGKQDVVQTTNTNSNFLKWH